MVIVYSQVRTYTNFTFVIEKRTHITVEWEMRKQLLAFLFLFKTTFNSTCEPDETDSGCETVVDYCQDQPCFNEGICHSDYQLGKYVCSCPQGTIPFYFNINVNIHIGLFNDIVSFVKCVSYGSASCIVHLVKIML